MGSRFIRDVLQPINTAAISIMGVYTILWGIWVANPWWNTFERAQAFEIMALVAPEYIWGLVAISVGIIIMRGTIKQSYNALTRGALFGFLQWITVSGFFFFGDWQNTGGITYLMLAVYCGFIWLNLRVNKKNFDV